MEEDVAAWPLRSLEMSAELRGLLEKIEFHRSRYGHLSN